MRRVHVWYGRPELCEVDQSRGRRARKITLPRTRITSLSSGNLLLKARPSPWFQYQWQQNGADGYGLDAQHVTYSLGSRFAVTKLSVYRIAEDTHVVTQQQDLNRDLVKECNEDVCGDLNRGRA